MHDEFEVVMGDTSNGPLGKYKDLAACVVWTPIPVLTWLLPCFGHIGIVTSTGILRDFAGPYYVETDNMAFGKPTKYLQMDLKKVPGGPQAWDNAVMEASEEYKKRNHNLFCDNCHDFVAMALNRMEYNKGGWNMMKLAMLMFVAGRFLGVTAFLKTWLPSIIIIVIIIVVSSI